MMRLLTLFLLCGFTFFLSGCQPETSSARTGSGSAQVDDVLALTAADNGKTVNRRVGEALTIALSGNASTGYSWALSQSGSPVLAESGSPVSASAASAKGVVGAPEVTTWVFLAMQAGDATLKLEYRRPWEKDSAPAQTFEVKVSVAK